MWERRDRPETIDGDVDTYFYRYMKTMHILHLFTVIATFCTALHLHYNPLDPILLQFCDIVLLILS